MISLRARVIRFASKLFFKRVHPDADVAKMRRIFTSVEARRKLAKGVTQSPTTIAGVRCLWLVPDGCADAPVLYYLHGGAYLMGNPETHRKMVSHIAREGRMRALLPDYRLAPENPFPAGLDDCIAVYRELLTSGVTPQTTVIGGDSAGGGMTMATLFSLRDAGDPLPGAAVLLSPWLDLTASGESATSRADVDPWFRPAEMQGVARMYSPEGDLEQPLLSPVFGSMHDLPVFFVQVGDHEILLSDATRLRDRVLAAGGEFTLEIWPQMWHVFQFFIRQMPESKRAIAAMGEFLRARQNHNE